MLYNSTFDSPLSICNISHNAATEVEINMETHTDTDSGRGRNEKKKLIELNNKLS